MGKDVVEWGRMRLRVNPVFRDRFLSLSSLLSVLFVVCFSEGVPGYWLTLSSTSGCLFFLCVRLLLCIYC